MVSLNTTVARHRIFYPRPIRAMPDIMMINIPAEFQSGHSPFGEYYPILIETLAEQQELDAYLEDERQDPAMPDLLDERPSAFAATHVSVAHYGPPAKGWPFVLLCRWPAELVVAAPKDLRMFIRDAYTIELFASREQLERESDTLLALLKRRRRARVEVISPEWSAVPGKPLH